MPALNVKEPNNKPLKGVTIVHGLKTSAEQIMIMVQFIDPKNGKTYKVES